MDNAVDNLRYYSELDGRFANYYEEDIRDNLAVINEMSNAADRNKRIELGMQFEKVLDEYFSKFLPLLQ